jgi:hypothetical protein
MAERRNFTDPKSKVALDALCGDKTLQEIAAKHRLHPNHVSTWTRQAIANRPRTPGYRTPNQVCKRETRTVALDTWFQGTL